MYKLKSICNSQAKASRGTDKDISSDDEDRCLDGGSDDGEGDDEDISSDVQKRKLQATDR